MRRTDLRHLLYRIVAGACTTCVVTPALAQQPGYAGWIALRSSSGFSAALEAAEGQLSLDSSDATAAGVRALVYANAVDFLGMSNEQAREVKRKSLASALALSGTNPWTRAAFGLIHMFDEPEAAQRELEACIAANPDFLECYNLYGDTLRKTGQLEKAGNVYRRGLKRWPKDGELLTSNALLLQQEGQLDAALKVLRDLTRDQPGFARGHWHLASMLYETGGDRAIARREVHAALRLDPLIWHGKMLLDLLGERQP